VAARGWGGRCTPPVIALLTSVWSTLAQPLLFGLIGAAVDVRQLDASLVLRVRACHISHNSRSLLT
jgi:hypothetical protein